MDREKEEIIQRLTARYVSEFRSGQQPLLSPYLSRYLQYAGLLADFVTYFHAFEVDVPHEGEMVPALSGTTQAALERAWKNVSQIALESNQNLNSLSTAARNVNKTFLQVALEIGLGLDILKKLDRHSIDAATIPLEVCHRLATALHQPVAVIEMYLKMDKHQQARPGIAESSLNYHIEDQPVLETHVRSFREAVARSRYMSGERKRDWQAILLDEGLM